MMRVLLAVAVAAMPATALAHGTTYRTSMVETAVVEFAYTDGERMAFMPFQLFAPGAGVEPARSGRTDREGRISFLADGEGTWRIEVRDEEGHRVRAEVVVAGGRAVTGSPSLPAAVAAASLALNAIAAAMLVSRLIRALRRRARRRPLAGQVSQAG
jgi:hypothetical protein